ncbi:hypothetical protein M438DRAFT_72121 [Aureobasidium pullulans EXF-150]|uniref:Uncharacterized protein n=1 Tax=Aureobasidium pullulans EXF-150 TaxID=1043002 RepID=A0A074Y4I6_AURPU|nr:uncharacterized protein M438DRAFT_72121 [Aureobasidium pullulans EXF-150]KEQ81831.1 hypothetical protein M438DRAFT_72121 [Aureobasidium pullulans EXF-150]
MAKALGKDSLSLFLRNKERANEDAMAPQRPRRKRALITGRNWERYRYQCQDVRSRDACHGEWQAHLKEFPTKANGSYAILKSILRDEWSYRELWWECCVPKFHLLL